MSTIYSAILGGLTVGLPLIGYIVHKTKTRKDDKILEWIESILPLLPKSTPQPPVKTERVPGVPVDHRG